MEPADLTGLPAGVPERLREEGVEPPPNGGESKSTTN